MLPGRAAALSQVTVTTSMTLESTAYEAGALNRVEVRASSRQAAIERLLGPKRALNIFNDLIKVSLWTPAGIGS